MYPNTKYADEIPELAAPFVVGGKKSRIENEQVKYEHITSYEYQYTQRHTSSLHHRFITETNRDTVTTMKQTDIPA